MTHGRATRSHGRGPSLPALASTIDRAVMGRWRRPRRGAPDELLVALSAAADYSRLWLALAMLLALAGGCRGRRAALHGILALGLASGSVNGPLKLAFGRRRPPGHRPLRRVLRSSSFPSGHSASAFAFATAATRELPQAGALLVPLAAAVAYSRVYVGAHYPSDVAAGAAIGTATGAAARPLVRRLRDAAGRGADPSGRVPHSREAVLVVSPHAGRSGRLPRARRAIEQQGVEIAAQLDIRELDGLRQLLTDPHGRPRLVIAAGGDGTVGSVAAVLAGADNALAILPLGTANDFARSLGVPMDIRRAAELICSGRISRVDLGRLIRPGEPPNNFVHAGTVGLNVSFARLATRPSFRARLGPFTYAAAALYATRERQPFRCTLRHDGEVEELDLIALTAINAPVFGGPLGLRVGASAPDDGRLVVLAICDVPARRVLLAALLLLLRIPRPVAGLRAMRVEQLGVESEVPLPVALDGEISGDLPGEFGVLRRALRVLTPGSVALSQRPEVELRFPLSAGPDGRDGVDRAHGKSGASEGISRS